ncbi:MAG: DUF475 domain-containing protein [Victivallales bacterium]
MSILSIILIVAGLCLFEIITSIDNAIINAGVLSTMSERARRWFLLWGLLFAVFIVRGALPWIIVWAVTPSLGPVGALTATFSDNPSVKDAIAKSAPVLLAGGGVFLVFLFIEWLFVEPKKYSFSAERFFHSQPSWFYAVVALALSVIAWLAMKKDPAMVVGALVGSTAFFIMLGFKHSAEKSEKKIVKSIHSDLSKIIYLEAIDTTFSIDGVLGAFAFTLSVPLIIIGNGIGAFVLREFTVRNIDTIKKYAYLKNGAMYSVFILGLIMLSEAFGVHVPSWVSPAVTFLIVGYFLHKSISENKVRI